MQASETLIKAVIATAEVMGSEMSEPGARMMCSDLAEYAEPAVLEALTRCRREVKGRLTLADVISRIDDGRPGPNEAWAMIPQGQMAEMQTVVWTEEMATAWGSASRLAEDPIAARMAFIESYQKEITKARAQNKPVRWRVSLGQEPSMREFPIRDAVEKGKISAEYARTLLPNGVFEEIRALTDESGKRKRIGGEWHIAKLLKKEPA